MLAYALFALARFVVRSLLHDHELCDSSAGSNTQDFRDRRKMISELSQGLGILKGISSAAPFLGLAGTSYGILCALWFPSSGLPERYVAFLLTRIAFASTTTPAGIGVALSASIFHTVLRVRVESISAALSLRTSYTGRVRSFRFAETLPLKKRFSSFPPFALLAAPALACVVALFTPFHPYRVRLARPSAVIPLPPGFPGSNHRIARYGARRTLH